MSRVRRPCISTTMATPHESCSNAGLYNPTRLGVICTCPFKDVPPALVGPYSIGSAEAAPEGCGLRPLRPCRGAVRRADTIRLEILPCSAERGLGTGLDKS